MFTVKCWTTELVCICYHAQLMINDIDNYEFVATTWARNLGNTLCVKINEKDRIN